MIGAQSIPGAGLHGGQFLIQQLKAATAGRVHACEQSQQRTFTRTTGAVQEEVFTPCQLNIGEGQFPSLVLPSEVQIPGSDGQSVRAGTVRRLSCLAVHIRIVLAVV
ncbi:hypothetical protein MspRI1_09920 [Marinobacter sp. RI1]